MFGGEAGFRGLGGGGRTNEVLVFLPRGVVGVFGGGEGGAGFGQFLTFGQVGQKVVGVAGGRLGEFDERETGAGAEGVFTGGPVGEGGNGEAHVGERAEGWRRHFGGRAGFEEPEAIERGEGVGAAGAGTAGGGNEFAIAVVVEPVAEGSGADAFRDRVGVPDKQIYGRGFGEREQARDRLKCSWTPGLKG